MQFKNFFQFMSVATLACTVCLTTQAQGAEAKTKSKKTLIAHRYNQYFVPPPPAYVPSVGLNSNYGNSVEADASENAAPANPYSKYIYVRPGSGYQAPTPVQQNHGVTTYYSRG